jgi:uncharacterized protein
MRNSLIVFFFLASTSLFAQEGFKGFKGEHFIEVTGSAETEVDPNEITLQIRLKEFEENRTKVQLEKLDQDFLSALKAAGIEKKRLSLADAGSELGKFRRKDKDAFREKTYQLVLTSGAELEKLLEKLEPVKVDQLAVTRVHHTDYEKIKLDLKIKALQAARTKAEALLKSINAEIGRPLMVREWDDPVYPVDLNANVMYKARTMQQEGAYADAAEPATEFRKIRMRVQVSAQFEIK